MGYGSIPSVGPSYLAVARRYAGKPSALKQLGDKVIQGGSGNWGERAMSAHPALSTKDAEKMVAYILSLSAEIERLALKSTFKLTEHIGKGKEGVYLLNASYRDHGANGIGELAWSNHIVLRDPLIQTEDFDNGNVRVATITPEFRSYITNLRNGQYISFRGIDLTGIKSLGFQVQAIGHGGKIELRLGKVGGPIVSTISIPLGNPKQPDNKWKKMEAPVVTTTGKNDLYFVFTGAPENQDYFNIDWIQFNRQELKIMSQYNRKTFPGYLSAGSVF